MKEVDQSVNIISFDVPYPANYGGVIDVYYKLVWLKRMGVKVHLHCFAYGRPPVPELEAVCETVHYYQRNMSVSQAFTALPYTVASRRSRELAENLLKNDYPILFEVLHTCYLAKDERFRDRLLVYRHSNIEHRYYRELAKTEKSLVRRLYLITEAWRLKRFERTLRHVDTILAVNQADTQYFQKHYRAKPVYLPSFHPNDSVRLEGGKGNYILFHGNLGISENYESAMWLVEHVFSHIIFPVVIAGLKPPAFLRQAVAKYRHIELVADPPEDRMNELVRNAQVHCLHTHQPTGLKLKLLNVLFCGRYIVTNREMIAGTGLREAGGLIVTGTANEYVTEINRVFTSEFGEALKEQRSEMMRPFSNEINAARLIKELRQIT